MAQSQTEEEMKYSALIGPECDEKLIFATSENYVANPESIQIACSEGYVSLEDCR